MLRTAPPIQAPSAQVIAEISNLIENRLVISGPVLCFDRENRIYVVAVIEQGVIVHWQLESCHDESEANALHQRYRGFVVEAAALLRAQSAMHRTVQ